MFTNLKAPPITLYIHFPWCLHKCPYCDFNSHASTSSEIPEQRYIDALIADFDQELPQIWGRRFSAIFIGGGTPSLLSPAGLERLLSELRARVPQLSQIELTLEANPGSVDSARFQAFVDAGINRFSIGVQSFNDKHLKRIERIHDRKLAENAIKSALTSGAQSVNIDLMFGLPEQNLAEARGDIDLALEFAPQHLSYYQLTIEANTLFHHHPPALPHEDVIAEMHDYALAQLQKHGYHHYEVSAFAKPHHQCGHNLNYWQFGDYLGIGAGAHSKLTLPQNQTIQRSWKLKNPRDYMQHAAHEQRIGGHHTLGKNELVSEFMMNALRLRDGFASQLFMERTGLTLANIERALEYAEAQKLIDWDHQTIRPTSLGRQYLNDLVEIFIETSSNNERSR